MYFDSKQWIFSIKYDFLFLLSPFWTFPLFILFSKFFSPSDLPWIYFLIIALHSRLHVAFPITFGLTVLKDKLSIFNFSLLKATILLLSFLWILCILGLFYEPILFFVVPTVTAFWATWHFYKQDLGICSLYRIKSSANDKLIATLERFVILFFSLINPIHYWLRTGFRYFAVKPYIDLSFLDAFLPWSVVRIIGTLILVLYILALVFRKNFSLPRVLFLITLYIQFISMTTLWIIPPMVEYLFRIFSHNNAEFGLQLKMWARLPSKLSDWLSLKLWVLPFLVTIVIVGSHLFITRTWPFLILINDNGFLDVEKFFSAGDPFLVASLIAVICGYNWAHYFLGRYVYDFSNPITKSLLLDNSPDR